MQRLEDLDFHVQKYETSRLPAFAELLERFGIDGMDYPMMHHHKSGAGINGSDPTEPPSDGSMPGAPANEIQYARKILQKVYARDIVAIERADAAMKQRHK